MFQRFLHFFSMEDHITERMGHMIVDFIWICILNYFLFALRIFWTVLKFSNYFVVTPQNGKPGWEPSSKKFPSSLTLLIDTCLSFNLNLTRSDKAIYSNGCLLNKTIKKWILKFQEKLHLCKHFKRSLQKFWQNLLFSNICQSHMLLYNMLFNIKTSHKLSKYETLQ